MAFLVETHPIVNLFSAVNNPELNRTPNYSSQVFSSALTVIPPVLLDAIANFAAERFHLSTSLT